MRVLLPFAAGFYERCKNGISQKEEKSLMYAFGNIPLTSTDWSGIWFVLHFSNSVRCHIDGKEKVQQFIIAQI